MKWSLITLVVCLAYLHICNSSTLRRRFDKFSYLKEFFCSEDEECEQGCCKGFFCMDYLEEGEKCLLKHKLRVGCGCRPGLECALKGWDLFICVNPENENPVEELRESVEFGNNDVTNHFEESRKREIFPKSDDVKRYGDVSKREMFGNGDYSKDYEIYQREMLNNYESDSGRENFAKAVNTHDQSKRKENKLEDLSEEDETK